MDFAVAFLSSSQELKILRRELSVSARHGSQLIDYTLANTWTSDYVADLNSQPYFFIRLDEDISRRFETEDHIDLTFLISNDSEFQENIRIDDKNNPTQEVDIRLTRKLKISFHDVNGNYLDFSNNDWILILKQKYQP